MPFLISGLLFVLAMMVGRNRLSKPLRSQECQQEQSQQEEGVHPESLTAILDPAAEEFLAWLADHHWPGDEYLEIEWEWRSENGSPEVDDRSACPQCRRHGDDVWPCRKCGQTLHSSCGHGLRRRRVAQPYRTRDMNAEAVIAEWLCTGCTAVVGLDVDHGDEEADGDLSR